MSDKKLSVLTSKLWANAPTEEGFYWATSIRRKCRKTRPGDYGQAGGLRWIVRVFRYDYDEAMRVQTFGNEMLRDVRDYKEWEGPIGRMHWPKISA
jgi:hypothetical protein